MLPEAIRFVPGAIPAHCVHEADDLPGLLHPVEDGPVSRQLLHQPGVGGQSGGAAPAF